MTKKAKNQYYFWNQMTVISRSRII